MARMKEAEKIAIAVQAALAARDAGTDPVAAAIASVAPVENKIDRAALQARIDEFLSKSPMPATDAVFAALNKISELVKDAEGEQDLIVASLLSTLTAEEKALVKISAHMTSPTPENGGAQYYERLGVSVPARREIVHAEGFQRARGWSLVENAEEIALGDDTLAPWYDAFKTALQGSDDGMLHNADFRAAYHMVAGKETTANFKPESMSWGALLEKKYA